MKLLLPAVLVLSVLIGLPLAIQQWQPRLQPWGRPATADASTAVPAWDPYLRAPGASVRLIVPDGFWLHPRHPGYLSEARDASLLVNEYEEPFHQARRRYEPQVLAAQGMAFEQASPIRIDGVPGLLIRATQTRPGKPRYGKLIAAVGDDRRTIVITATWPEPYNTDDDATVSALGQSMEAALLSAKFEPGERPNVMGGLPLRIEPAAGFTFAARTQDGVVFTRDGQLPTDSPDAAQFLAGVSDAGGEILDRRAFALDQLAQLQGVRDLLIHSSNYASVAGLPAYEILATATLNDGDRPCLIHLTLAFDGRSVYTLRGIGLYSHAQTCLEHFRAMTGSLRLTGAAQPPIAR